MKPDEDEDWAQFNPLASTKHSELLHKLAAATDAFYSDDYDDEDDDIASPSIPSLSKSTNAKDNGETLTKNNGKKKAEVTTGSKALGGGGGGVTQHNESKEKALSTTSKSTTTDGKKKNKEITKSSDKLAVTTTPLKKTNHDFDNENKDHHQELPSSNLLKKQHQSNQNRPSDTNVSHSNQSNQNHTATTVVELPPPASSREPIIHCQSSISESRYPIVAPYPKLFKTLYLTHLDYTAIITTTMNSSSSIDPSSVPSHQPSSLQSSSSSSSSSFFPPLRTKTTTTASTIFHLSVMKNNNLLWTTTFPMYHQPTHIRFNSTLNCNNSSIIISSKFQEEEQNPTTTTAATETLSTPLIDDALTTGPISEENKGNNSKDSCSLIVITTCFPNCQLPVDSFEDENYYYNTTSYVSIYDCKTGIPWILSSPLSNGPISLCVSTLCTAAFVTIYGTIHILSFYKEKHTNFYRPKYQTCQNTLSCLLSYDQNLENLKKKKKISSIKKHEIIDLLLLLPSFSLKQMMYYEPRILLYFSSGIVYGIYNKIWERLDDLQFLQSDFLQLPSFLENENHYKLCKKTTLSDTITLKELQNFSRYLHGQFRLDSITSSTLLPHDDDMDPSTTTTGKILADVLMDLLLNDYKSTSTNHDFMSEQPSINQPLEESSLLLSKTVSCSSPSSLLTSPNKLTTTTNDTIQKEITTTKGYDISHLENQSIQHLCHQVRSAAFLLSRNEFLYWLKVLCYRAIDINEIELISTLLYSTLMIIRIEKLAHINKNDAAIIPSQESNKNQFFNLNEGYNDMKKSSSILKHNVGCTPTRETWGDYNLTTNLQNRSSLGFFNPEHRQLPLYNENEDIFTDASSSTLFSLYLERKAIEKENKVQNKNLGFSSSPWIYDVPFMNIDTEKDILIDSIAKIIFPTRWKELLILEEEEEEEDDTMKERDIPNHSIIHDYTMSKDFDQLFEEIFFKLRGIREEIHRIETYNANMFCNDNNNNNNNNTCSNTNSEIILNSNMTVNNNNIGIMTSNENAFNDVF